MRACFWLNEMPVLCFFRGLSCPEGSEGLPALVAIVCGAGASSTLSGAISSDVLFVPRGAILAVI